MDLELKKLIDQVRVVSFDVFDTLILRIVNDPETVFELVGQKFELCGYRAIRQRVQAREGVRLFAEKNYPHADMDEIYNALSKTSFYDDVDWNAIKECELQIERDALVRNDEIYEVYKYAKAQGKRVIATTDMYLKEAFISECLEKCGYKDLDKVYCSADERAAKFNKELFYRVICSESVSANEMLHIGDSLSADVEIPTSFGIKTWHYVRENGMEKIAGVNDSQIDKGLYNYLYRKGKGFWYNLGVEVGGPLYMGLYLWLKERVDKQKPLFLLARDGYNLCELLKKLGYKKAKYLKVSRRSLLLAGITDLDQESLNELPPFTFGQTVGEILDYLCLNRDDIKFLDEVGFEDFDAVIKTLEDMEAMHRLFVLNKQVVLDRCELERNEALKYFNEQGVLDEDSIMFDCGWSGSSQLLIDRFKKAVGCKYDSRFLYFGIKNSEKSIRQTTGRHYESFAFDYFKRYNLQHTVSTAVVLYELFFSAPHASVLCYQNGEAVLENDEVDKTKESLLKGIIDFVKTGLPFAEKYRIDYSPEIACARLNRLILHPTIEEAQKIGDLENVDSFANKKGEKKYIGFVTEEQIEKNPNTEIYWLNGLLLRKDVPEALKTRIASMKGVQYPVEKTRKYNLERIEDIIKYYKWNYDIKKQDVAEYSRLNYNPKFSVVMPVYNTDKVQLEEAIKSVLNQTYNNYELLLVDDASTMEEDRNILQKYEMLPEIRVIWRSENGNISVATNDGIDASNGEFIVFMDCDDTIEPCALFEFAKKLNENGDLDFIYSDEDKLTEDGCIYHNPFFKPDWSPDLFMSEMYTNHLSAYRASIVKELNGLRTAYNGAQDYDMTLRFLEHTTNDKVGHINKVLYHWRERKESIASSIGAKNYALIATKYAKEASLKRRNISGRMELAEIEQYKPVYEVNGNPLISIIIPSKDNFDILKQCIESIYDFSEYRNFEIIIVDNGSSDDVKKKIEKEYGSKCKYIYMPSEFNFSRMCNVGAKAATGDILLFLNDDVRIVQGDWLNRMAGQAQLSYAGAVGAKLFFPGNTIIQHAGVSNIKEGPSHNFLRTNDIWANYFALNWLEYDSAAVTGACLMVETEKFWRVNGFNTSLGIAYNDIDLCFKLLEEGLYNVTRNDVIAFHYESYSRGQDLEDINKMKRLENERSLLYNLHPKMYQYDSFLNRNIHTYNVPIDLFIDNSKVTEENIEGTIVKGTGVVDRIFFVDNHMIISGNSQIENEDMSKTYRKLVIFTDDKTLCVDVDSIGYENLLFKDNSLVSDSQFSVWLDRFEWQSRINAMYFGMITICNGKKFYSPMRIKQQSPVNEASAIEHVLFKSEQEALLDYCKNKRHLYIYGAGNYGKRMAAILQQNNIDFDGFVVSDPARVKNEKKEKDIIEVSSVAKDDSIAIITALKPIFRDEVMPLLKNKGFDNVFDGLKLIQSETNTEDQDVFKAEQKALLNYCKNKKHIYIYGAGVYGKKMAALLKQNSIDFDAFIVTDTTGIKKEKSIIDISSIIRDKNTGIVMALKPIFRDEVLPLLESKGLYNVFDGLKVILG